MKPAAVSQAARFRLSSGHPPSQKKQQPVSSQFRETLSKSIYEMEVAYRAELETTEHYNIQHVPTLTDEPFNSPRSSKHSSPTVLASETRTPYNTPAVFEVSNADLEHSSLIRPSRDSVRNLARELDISYSNKSSSLTPEAPSVLDPEKISPKRQPESIENKSIALVPDDEGPSKSRQHRSCTFAVMEGFV